MGVQLSLGGLKMDDENIELIDKTLQMLVPSHVTLYWIIKEA